MNNIKNIKGTLDLFGNNLIKLKKLIKIFEKYFILYGYKQIETPFIEKFNIINKIKKYNNYPIFFKIKKKYFLIFDLTIPLIRFCLTNINKLILPFKRYQIQKVWRGEKPQNNRYREFYQCDIDIISLKSNYEEIEIVKLCDNIFNKLNLSVIFLINHKDILYGLCEYLNIYKKNWFFFIKNIDKIDKKGEKKIKKILIKKIKKEKINKIFYFFKKKKKNIKFLLYLKKKFKKNKKYGLKGIKYLLKFFKIIYKIKLKKIKIKFEISLSRGLNYYSKTFFEIKFLNKINNLSLGGGGRYDKLFKLNNKNIKGIGISFGIYRIYNILNNINYKFFKNKKKKILIINFKLNKYYNYIIKYFDILIKNKFITFIYPYKEKIKKQIKYAILNKYNYLIFLGNKEIKNNFLKLKDLYKKKEKIFYNIYKLINFIKKK